MKPRRAWIFLSLLALLPVRGQPSRPLTIVLSGDTVLTQRLSVYDEPDYRRLVALVREADAAFTNFEMLLHNYEAPAAPFSGGTYMVAPPALARELAWMGFDLVSTANNHAVDYGPEGLLSTLRALSDAGLVAAGTGENLARARAPAYFETRGGRIALLAVSSTFPPTAPAGEQRRDLRGRPGLSPLRHKTLYYLDAQSFAALQQVRKSLGMDRWDDPAAPADRVTFLGQEFRRGDSPGVETLADPSDLAEITQALREARRQADWVMVSLHAHESGGAYEIPADFIVEFAHAVVDAGADLVVAHGPHLLRGVEIYKGRPVFYSLGNFVFQNETVAFLPAEMYRRYGVDPSLGPADVYDARTERDQRGFPANPAYWESVVAEVRFERGRAAEVRLYPIVLGQKLARPQRGRPLLAEGEGARRILERVAELSKKFGTRIEVRDTVGYITIPRD